MALTVSTGKDVAQTTKWHRLRDCVSVLRELDEQVHHALAV
jgi:hypothetical protein